MIWKRIVFFFVLIIFTARLQAVNSNIQYKHGIGVAAGFVTGYGLSYRFLNNKTAYQITFAPYVSAQFSLISLGVARIHTIYEAADFADLLYYIGVQEHYDSSCHDETGRMVEKYRINLGAGPGIRFKISNHVRFDIMFGYAIYNTIGQPSSVNFTGETALFYYF